MVLSASYALANAWRGMGTVGHVILFVLVLALVFAVALGTYLNHRS